MGTPSGRIIEELQVLNPALSELYTVEIQKSIALFTTLVRQELMQQHGTRITPKLHLLMCHLADEIEHFAMMGLGLGGEQGGESLHNRFNELSNPHFYAIKDELQQPRLVTEVFQRQNHLTT